MKTSTKKVPGGDVKMLDSAIHRINHYPADNVIDFLNTYLLDGVYLVDSAI